ncbi:hypothetical protein VTO73DRAFT_4325 [Trametes versicolor]
MSTTTQKALLMPTPGGLYTVGEVEVPRPGPNDVLVKIHVAALNPGDWKVTLPEYMSLGWGPGYPFTPGTDGAGLVVEVGAEVSNFKKGDRVLFQGCRAKSGFTTFQEHSLVRAPLLAKIPDSISFDAAATVPSGLGSVVLALYNQESEQESLGLKPFWSGEGGKTAYAGKPIFILGGATCLGQYAIQHAKLSGFNPIITTASPRNAALLTSLGATHVVDRTRPAAAILADLPALTGGKPIDVIFDAVSDTDTQTLAYRALSPGGPGLMLVLPETIPAELKKNGPQKRVAMVRGSVYQTHTHAIAVEMFDRVTGWLEEGLIKPNACEVVPNGLAGIAAGLERLKSGAVSAKKLGAHPQETP